MNGPSDRGPGARRVLSRYSAVAIALHWAIALLIGFNLYLGFRMGAVTGLEQFDLFQLHKSVGITVLLITLLRIVWRLFNRPPAHVDDLKGWEHAASGTVHVLLYGLMLGLPLTGWLLVTTSPLNIPTLLYHSIPWPHVPLVRDLSWSAKAKVYGVADKSHVALVWGGLALIALHVGAAFKHQLLDRDAVLPRMVPLLRPWTRKG